MSRIFGEDDFAIKEELEEKLWELKGYVTRYLRALGIKDDILDDVVQETMVDAWMHMNQLRDVSLMKSWVRTIAKNTGFRYIKKSNVSRCGSFLWKLHRKVPPSKRMRKGFAMSYGAMWKIWSLNGLTGF